MFEEDGLFNKSIEEKFEDILFDPINKGVVYDELMKFIKTSSMYELLLEQEGFQTEDINKLVSSSSIEFNDIFKSNLITIMGNVLNQIE